MIALRKSLLAIWTIDVQEKIACICCVAMVVGLLFSRGLLSSAMILMFLNACHPSKIKETWSVVRYNGFAICCFLFFMAYLISGLWSTDKASWLMSMQIKLPFVFLPFALLNAPLQSIRYRKLVIGGLLLVLLSGMLYSFSYLVLDPYYLKKNLHLPSPVKGDYIRFTIALVLGLQFVFYFFLEKKIFPIGKGGKMLLFFWAIIAVLYIHIQAAKSGLLCFYVLSGIYVLFVFPRKKKWLILISVVAIIGLGVLGALFVPSLNKQLKNIAYEQQVWETGDSAKYNQTSSFVPRLISYKIAGKIIKKHPLAGVGAGDLKSAMDKEYQLGYQSISKTAWLLPHNQFLCTAISTGLFLALSLLLMLVAPLVGTKMRIYTIATLAVMFLGLMIEPMLETQYGVFVYLFFTLFWISVLKKP